MALQGSNRDRDFNNFTENPVDQGVDRRVVVKNDSNNPIPVKLQTGSVNIGTVNAELEVQLSHQDNVPNAGDVADSVQIGDGVEKLAINPDLSINARRSGYASFDQTAITVTTSEIEAKVGASRFANRKLLRIINTSNNTIYFGKTGVNSTNGEPIFKNQWVEITIGDVAIYLIASSGSNSVVVSEWA